MAFGKPSCYGIPGHSPNRWVSFVISMSDNILIAVPSKGRADILRERTAKVLKGFEYEVFVEPQEADEYAEWNPQVLPKNDQGICYAMAKIKEYAQANDYEYVLKVDDDVGGLDVGRLLDVAQNAFSEIDSVSAVSAARSHDTDWDYLFVNHQLESVFIIKVSEMIEELGMYHHDVCQSIHIWESGGVIIQSGVGVQNDIGTLDGGCGLINKNIKDEKKYKRLRNNYTKLQQGTLDEVKNILDGKDI